MRCLYCRKAIGPIRQLRDLEFCSDAHRQEFREQFRQRAFEALAPEPAPTRLADFRVRYTPAKGPAPHFTGSVLAKTGTDGCQPVIPVAAAGIRIDRQSFVLGSAPAPARASWDASTVARRIAVPSAPFVAAVEATSQKPAGMARTSLVAERPAPGVAFASARFLTTSRRLMHTAWLPGAFCSPSFASSGMRAPQLSPENPAVQLAVTSHVPRASVPPMFAVSLPEPASHTSMASAGMRVPQFASTSGVPQAAVSRLTASRRTAAVAFPDGAAIAGPRTPAQQTPQAGLSPASILSQPRPQESETLQPAAIGTAGIAKFGVALPKAPDAATAKTIAPSSNVYAAPRIPELTPAVAAGSTQPALPGLEITFRAGEQIERATRRPLGLAPMLRLADLQPVLPSVSPAWHAETAEAVYSGLGVECSAVPMAPGAGLLPAAKPPVQQAEGNLTPRQDIAQAPVRNAVVTPRMQTGVAAGAVSAPVRDATPLRSAVPPSAAPAWNSSRIAQHDSTPAFLPNVALPKVDCTPALAGALATPARPWYPGVGRSMRTCAVLWTLRAGHLSSPDFNVLPVRAKFNDLIVAGGPFGRDAADPMPRKSNLRVISGGRDYGRRKVAWSFMGAAAAAVLIAGALRLPMSLGHGSGSALPGRPSVRQWMAAHALRDFGDDFRGGLDQWKGGPASGPKGWSYSRDGFVHPGQMALFRPSVPLTDYHFEFMAQIENKSVDWVVRAQDPKNYYAVKFTVLQPGPRPMVAMVRYPVIAGNIGSRVLTPLRMMIHANTPYRVTMDVKGNNYRTFIEDQETDFWTDDRLKSGGVGFFSEAGERARVYWVKLESHGDLLGRICGMLSGGNSPEGTTKENEAWITGIQLALMRPTEWNLHREP